MDKNISAHYLSQFHLQTKKLGKDNTEKILLAALSDYTNGKISLQELSFVATDLLYEFNKPFDVQGWSDFDSSFLAELSEAGYYLQRSQEGDLELSGKLKSLEKKIQETTSTQKTA